MVVVLWELIYGMDRVRDFLFPIVLLHNRHIDQFHYGILHNAIWYPLKVPHHTLYTVEKISLISNGSIYNSYIEIIVRTLYPTCLYAGESCSFSAFT